MLGVWSNSAKTKVFGAEVAWFMRSIAARGEVADLERRMYGSRAFRAFCWVGSMMKVLVMLISVWGDRFGVLWA